METWQERNTAHGINTQHLFESFFFCICHLADVQNCDLLDTIALGPRKHLYIYSTVLILKLMSLVMTEEGFEPKIIIRKS